MSDNEQDDGFVPSVQAKPEEQKKIVASVATTPAAKPTAKPTQQVKPPQQDSGGFIPSVQHNGASSTSENPSTVNNPAYDDPTKDEHPYWHALTNLVTHPLKSVDQAHEYYKGVSDTAKDTLADTPTSNGKPLNSAQYVAKQLLTPSVGTVKRAGAGLGDIALMPIDMARQAYHAVADEPKNVVEAAVDTTSTYPGAGRINLAAKRLLYDPQAAEGEKAYQALEQGHKAEVIGHGLAAGIPIIGPMAAQLGEQAGKGDIAGAAAKGAVLIAAPRIARGAMPGTAAADRFAGRETAGESSIPTVRAAAGKIGDIAEETTGSRRPLGVASTLVRTPIRYPKVTAGVLGAITGSHLPISETALETLGGTAIGGAIDKYIPEGAKNIGLNDSEISMESLDKKVKTAEKAKKVAEAEAKVYIKGTPSVDEDGNVTENYENSDLSRKAQSNLEKANSELEKAKTARSDLAKHRIQLRTGDALGFKNILKDYPEATGFERKRFYDPNSGEAVIPMETAKAGGPKAGGPEAPAGGPKTPATPRAAQPTGYKPIQPEATPRVKVGDVVQDNAGSFKPSKVTSFIKHTDGKTYATIEGQNGAIPVDDLVSAKAEPEAKPKTYGQMVSDLEDQVRKGLGGSQANEPIYNRTAKEAQPVTAPEHLGQDARIHGTRMEAAIEDYAKNNGVDPSEVRMKIHDISNAELGELASHSGVDMGTKVVSRAKGNPNSISRADLFNQLLDRGETPQTILDRHEYLKAKKSFMDKATRSNAGLDPTMLSDAYEMAKYHIRNGFHKFEDFSSKMVAELGEAVRPYLEKLWSDAAEDYINEPTEAEKAADRISAQTARRNSTFGRDVRRATAEANEPRAPRTVSPRRSPDVISKEKEVQAHNKYATQFNRARKDYLTPISGTGAPALFDNTASTKFPGGVEQWNLEKQKLEEAVERRKAEEATPKETVPKDSELPWAKKAEPKAPVVSPEMKAAESEVSRLKNYLLDARRAGDTKSASVYERQLAKSELKLSNLKRPPVSGGSQDADVNAIADQYVKQLQSKGATIPRIEVAIPESGNVIKGVQQEAARFGVELGKRGFEQPTDVSHTGASASRTPRTVADAAEGTANLIPEATTADIEKGAGTILAKREGDANRTARAPEEAKLDQLHTIRQRLGLKHNQAPSELPESLGGQKPVSKAPERLSVRANAVYEYYEQPRELTTSHIVEVKDHSGASKAKVAAVSDNDYPDTWTVRLSASEKPGTGLGTEAYAKLLDKAQSEANRKGKTITVSGDSVQSDAAKNVWSNLKKSGYDVTYNTKGIPSVRFAPATKLPASMGGVPTETPTVGMGDFLRQFEHKPRR